MNRALVLLLCATLTACGRTAADAPLPGYAEAELVYVAASSAGRLQTLSVRRGQQVRAGALLFTLDPDAEALAREGAAARSERAAALAVDLRKGRRPSEIAAIDQQLAQAAATLAASTSALDRQRGLVEQGFVAAQQLDTLLATRDRDAARVHELQAQRVTALAAARSDEIAAATAEARGARADLALARWHEGEKQRHAPADALVFDTLFQPGEWVPSGQPVLVLLPPGAIKVRFFVPQPLLA
ncbi:MAG: HlyD family efflux transporter periplasmic adaptor subunit, partial [Bacteroidia bacterium]